MELTRKPFKPIKALVHVQYEKVAFQHDLEPNIALSFASCCISLWMHPPMLYCTHDSALDFTWEGVKGILCAVFSIQY